jgi:DNA-binding GntR family transcriptional regulator
MGAVHKIETHTLVDRVYEHILEQIISGAVRYGDTISLKGLAAELGVSTMPVREAVKRLEFEHVVSIKPRSSCRVRRPSRKMIREVYELREALEEFAVTRAVGRLDTAALARLREIVDAMREASREPDAVAREKTAVALDRQFHAALGALAGSDMLDAFYRQLSLHVNMTLVHEKTYHTLEQDWWESHAEILRCLESDPERAVATLREHFARVRPLLGADGPEDGAGEEDE